MLHGREDECDVLTRLLDDARARRSGVLVIRGEAGIGKSALLDVAAAQAHDMLVLRAAGVEAESELAYAAVHQLLRPVRGRFDAIPAGQRAALENAFGLGAEAVEGNRFLISVAVLSLLSEVAEDQPLLCLVDNAQWLDGPSADALAFVARRLDAEGVVLLFAARDDDAGAFGAPGLPELGLRGLEPAAARALLRERAGDELAPAVADRLVASTAGNPLGLLEVPGSLSAEQLAGLAPLPDRLPVGTVVEQVFLARVRQRPAATQTLLLVAAAEESGDVRLLLRAAEAVGVPPDALDDAETAGLVRVDGGVLTFRHPLVRSAVYRGATFLQRRAVEQALAAVLADEDVDRRAWHLAAAASGPDESVAEELERSATRAAHRGGHAAAATALQRAAMLTAPVDTRARRLTEAAEAAWLAGQPDRARTLLEQAAEIAADPGLRARGEHLRGEIEGLCGRPDTAYATLVAGSEPVVSLDPARAARMLVVAGRLAWTASDLPRLAEAGRRLASLPAVEDTVTAGARLMVGLATLLDGDAERAVPLLREGRRLAEDAAEPHGLMVAAGAALFLGEDAAALDLFTRAAARARAAGEVSALPLVLAPLAALHMWTGRFAAAATTASEGLRLALDIGQENPAAHHRSVLAWIAAAQGRADECRTEAEAALSHAIGQRLGPPAGIAAWALALLDLGEGRAAQAYDRLAALADAGPGDGHPVVKIFAAADLVEVAVRTDRPDRAEEAVARLEAWAGPAHAAWAHALVARCRGLLADGDAADEHFTRALSLHAAAGRPFDTARTALVFGEALRRRRRRADARRHLRAARETFERLDAGPWAELARVELQATGETARKRDPSTVAQLTPQELQIARLVGEGGTNREIAAHLFLSPRTVDYHLHKVFTKLGISSRAELVRLSIQDDSTLAGRRG